MKKITDLWKVTFFAVNIFIVMLLIVTSLFSYLTIQIIPLFSFLSLIVPSLFILNFLFFAYWLIKRKKKFVWSFMALLVGYIVFGSFYKIGSKSIESLDSDLKVMTYNVWGFNKNEWIKEPDIGAKIIEFIEVENPDIVCIQEHDKKRNKEFSQYEYSLVPLFSDSPKTIQAIFSKYPIINNGSLNLPNTINNIIYADIKYKTDTIRVYNVHLESFKIVPSSKTFSEEESEKNYKRLVKTFAKQLEQAKIFEEHKNNSPYKTIVCGDLNNTQFSNVYRILKGDLQDTFLENGKGFGRTYNLLGFPIRIDYILADSNFEVFSHENFDVKLSDHYPVMATLRIKSDE